jgi:hypothetical protein
MLQSHQLTLSVHEHSDRIEAHALNLGGHVPIPRQDRDEIQFGQGLPLVPAGPVASVGPSGPADPVSLEVTAGKLTSPPSPCASLVLSRFAHLVG